MYCIVVTLCLLSRAISTIEVKHYSISQNSLRFPRSAAVPSENGYVFNQFGDNSGMYALFASEDIEHNPYTGIEPLEVKSAEKFGVDMPSYPDLQSVPDIVADRIPSHTLSPMQYNSDYEKSRSTARANYASLVNQHRHTPDSPPAVNLADTFASYESRSDYHNDEDDVRSSGRTMYDNYWPSIYHSPFEYEYKKERLDMEKVKDKRYIDESFAVKPVHEHIKNDIPNTNSYTHTSKTKVSTDNPIDGNEPFFSFVLNDYYDKNFDEDPLSFKGIDSAWGKEFDHESYRPSLEDIIIYSKKDRLPKTEYSTRPKQWPTTIDPQHQHLASSFSDGSRQTYTGTHGATTFAPTMTPLSSTQSFSSSYTSPYTNNNHYSDRNSQMENGHKQTHDSDKHESGNNKCANEKAEYGSDAHKYEGFRDFLDSFANKFGSEDHKKDVNYEKENNENKGQKKKGFHRVYHKDEFLEDKEFYDDSNNKSKIQEKGSSKLHIGGSEALLRSQALGNVGNMTNAIRKSGNMGDKQFENVHKIHDGSNTNGNKFVKFIDVAKQAAQSNSLDYVDKSRT